MGNIDSYKPSNYKGTADVASSITIQMMLPGRSLRIYHIVNNGEHGFGGAVRFGHNGMDLQYFPCGQSNKCYPAVMTIPLQPFSESKL